MLATQAASRSGRDCELTFIALREVREMTFKSPMLASRDQDLLLNAVRK